MSQIRVSQIRVSQIRASQIRATEIFSNHRELHGAIFCVSKTVSKCALSSFQAAAHLQVSFRVSTLNIFVCLRKFQTALFCVVSKLQQSFKTLVFACPHRTLQNREVSQNKLTVLSQIHVGIFVSAAFILRIWAAVSCRHLCHVTCCLLGDFCEARALCHVRHSDQPTTQGQSRKPAENFATGNTTKPSALTGFSHHKKWFL